MIVKDEVSEAFDIAVDGLSHGISEVVITVSDKKAYTRFKKLARDYDQIKLDHRPWTNDFAAARNHNLALSKTDYFMWLDADDRFDFKDIMKLVVYAKSNKYDALYLPYNYAQDRDGKCIALHWRERILRRAKGFEWRGVVHESLLVDTAFRAKRIPEPEVFHIGGDINESKKRNHKILAEAVENKPLDKIDPRNLYYYGLSLFGIGKYKIAISALEDYLRVSGWDEEMYRALIKIGESYFMLDQHANAIEQTLKAVALKPRIPEAYYALARYEYALANWNETLDWIEVAASKPDYDTMSIQNPQIKEFAKIHAAIAQHSLGHYVLAYKYLQTVPEGMADELIEGFKMQANIETFINLVPELLMFIKGSDLYNVIPEAIRYDKRLKWLRNDVVEPKTWPDKSIVFFCGEGYEEWGAHTLDKGMGGSEEAVVYLSRELAKQGYNVTVYNHVNDTYWDQEWDDGTWSVEENTSVPNRVEYRPWRQFDERDQFDTLVVWRQPKYSDGLKAKTKIIDLHDILTPEHVQPRDDATYFVKSKYHRSLYPNAPDSNFKIIGNGLKKSQFDMAIHKKRHTVGYFSAYYRGLESLLRMWPAIKKEVPAAKLDIYYGWESWTKINGEDEFYKRMEAKFEIVKDMGVTVHGRVDHETLAKAMMDTEVWAYPTEFREIHCITALKAQEALCYPVTTDVAALAETVQSGIKLETDTIYSDEYQQKKFIKEVVAALKDHKTGTPVKGTDWSDVAKQWIKHIKGDK